MASFDEISEAINDLARHCRLPIMSEDQRAGWLRDWCTDLKAYPAEAVRHGCQQWRRTATKEAFPKFSELRPLIEAVVTRSQVGEKIEAWRRLSEGDYRALTLREKVRYQLALAADLRREAGPQWGGGRPKLAEDMPPVWHSLRAEAAVAEAEAKRLGEVLRRYKGDDQEMAA
jgi:hypothetical protein